MIDQAELLRWSMGFLLLLARVGAAMVMLPGIAETAIPPPVRIGLTLAICLLLFPSLQPLMPPIPEAGLLFASMIAAEAFAGLWFGWIAKVVAQTLTIAMQYAALLLGLSSVLQPDAELGPQTSALARMAEIATPLIILTSGLYRVILSALGDFYVLVPPGAGLPAGDSATAVVTAAAQALILSMRLASPFLVAAIVWNVTSGLVARLVPRLQIYNAAMPAQILGGLFLLSALSGTVLAAWQAAIADELSNLPFLR